MQKTKTYPNIKFDVKTLQKTLQLIESKMEEDTGGYNKSMYQTSIDSTRWLYDSEIEFFSDYRNDNESAFLMRRSNSWGLEMHYSRGDQCEIVVEAPTKADIESLFLIFEEVVDSAPVQDMPKPIPTPKPSIFIGHGGSPEWKDLKNHLQDQHDYQIEAYETGARAGHVIRDILEDMSRKSSFALLVFTAEDEDSSGNSRARQNVVHEAGLFQGRLGFNRAIVLLEHGVDVFSNLHGIQYIPFSKGNIKETYGDVLATLKREFD